MKKTGTKKLFKNRPHLASINLVCWLIIPCAIIITLVLDGLNIYILNPERLSVLGAGAIIVLTPFFSEITIKNISLKKENKRK